MKWCICVLLSFLAISFPFSYVGSAQNNIEQNMMEESKRQLETVLGPSEFTDFSKAADELANGSQGWSFSGLLSNLSDLFWGELKSNMSMLIKMVVVAIMAGVLCNIQGKFAGESISNLGFLTCFIVIAGIAVSIFSDIVSIASETIDTLYMFTQGLIPTISMIISSGGGGATASAMSPTLFVCMQVITYLAKNFFLPMNLGIFALSVINNVTERFHITKLIEFAKQGLKWGIGILLTVYVGLIGFQGISFGYLNGVAGKTVKYAVCNFIPLVGTALAESVEAVCASAVLVKNAVGMAGILSLISICLLPLSKMLVLSLLYRFAAGVAEPVTDRRITNFFSDIAGNITQTFVVLLMVCVMFMISVGLLCTFTNIPMN